MHPRGFERITANPEATHPGGVMSEFRMALRPTYMDENRSGGLSFDGVGDNALGAGKWALVLVRERERCDEEVCQIVIWPLKR
jgi:hypothetical protein